MKFKEWLNSKVTVSSYPKRQELLNYDVVINVSDEYNLKHHEIVNLNMKKYYWFPLNEFGNDMGLNSIFGAIQILHISELKGKKVLIHCHGGINRSQTVMDAYYFMRTGTHRPPIKISEEVDKMFGGESSNQNTKNCLQNNCDHGRLPAIKLMEKFLINIRTCIESQKVVSLDKIKLDSL